MDIIDEETGLKVPTADERNNAMFTHLASFASLMIPFGNILGPLLIWSLKKERSNFVDEHGKASLNFEITYTIIVFTAVILTAFMAITNGIMENPVGVVMSLLIFIVPIFAYWILSIVLVIVAAIKASNGEYYRYPLSIRFIK